MTGDYTSPVLWHSAFCVLHFSPIRGQWRHHNHLMVVQQWRLPGLRIRPLVCRVAACGHISWTWSTYRLHSLWCRLRRAHHAGISALVCRHGHQRQYARPGLGNLSWMEQHLATSSWRPDGLWRVHWREITSTEIRLTPDRRRGLGYNERVLVMLDLALLSAKFPFDCLLTR